MIACTLRGRFLGGRLVQYHTDSGLFLAWTMLVDVGGESRATRFCSCDAQVVSLVQLLADDGVVAQVDVIPLTLRPAIGFIAHRIRFGASERPEHGTAPAVSDAAQATGATA
jgi:hypothetical protein